MPTYMKESSDLIFGMLLTKRNIWFRCVIVHGIFYYYGCNLTTGIHDGECFYHFKSSLVPLIDGLCSLILQGFFYFLFRKEKYVKGKKQLVQDLIPPTIVYFVHIYEYIYAEI